MREKDRKRYIAMSEIKVRADMLRTMAKSFETVYEGGSDISAELQMEVLDKQWETLVENQLALSNLMRENGI